MIELSPLSRLHEGQAGAQDGHLIERRTGGVTLLSGGFLEVRRDDVLLPDGSAATREFVQHPGAVAVIPVLEDGRLVLVRQHRYPVAKVLLELPAGKLDQGESQIACAMRELKEETGYEAQEWAYGGEIHNAAAYSTESIWIWLARGLVAGAQRAIDQRAAVLVQEVIFGRKPAFKTMVLGAAQIQNLHRAHIIGAV